MKCDNDGISLRYICEESCTSLEDIMEYRSPVVIHNHSTNFIICTGENLYEYIPPITTICSNYDMKTLSMEVGAIIKDLYVKSNSLINSKMEISDGEYYEE